MNDEPGTPDCWVVLLGREDGGGIPECVTAGVIFRKDLNPTLKMRNL
jgi:hypothetical protein